MPFLRHSSHSSSRKDHKISKVDVTTIRVGSGDGISMLSAPREVVQATRAYIAQMPGEISFNKGDFFHVVSRGPGGQIQIRDPVRGISGSASMAHFRFSKSLIELIHLRVTGAVPVAPEMAVSVVVDRSA